ncbi:hypothetical protein GPECTOR_58g593 [Gonium pectorale]|uniref:Uncharacterized protein n=1 Tax=Gonium pectorale TaxID=33097 RepID=A0A150G5P7_GONPE|nr:hypothetical protein GPECTOR_58g593 [Gonium pectorale]|eukprot:KXZ45144.1 hypothetical protein GPECTOR_58g593 [Gonium pectorale]
MGRSGRQTAHLDAIVELEAVRGAAPVSAAETEGKRGENAEYRVARVTLPASALRCAGVLLLHLLPLTPQLHWDEGDDGEYGREEDAAVTAGGGAPLGTVPLLVLPAAAVREMSDLYGNIMGPSVVQILERTLQHPVPPAPGPAGGGASSPAATAAAPVGTAQEQSPPEPLLAAGALDTAAADRSRATWYPSLWTLET